MPNLNIKILSEKLQNWYHFNKREFPWRSNFYPNKNEWIYHTWVCEIMSQQTLISVVLPKFNEFILTLPDLNSLATCSEETLRKLWAGLGYYARARNLQKGAQYILNECQGHFPTTAENWLKVPGCGDYTSSIISSICFQEKQPAIDGNMIRVVSRLLALQKDVWNKSANTTIREFVLKLMEHLGQNQSPGDFNQAFMDLGSLVCKKQNPNCNVCPIQTYCLASNKNIVELCPPIKPRKETQKEKIEALVILNKKNQSFLVVERNEKFLKKTKGFPIFSTSENQKWNHILKIIKDESLQCHRFKNEFQHSITHHKITGRVTLITIEDTKQNHPLIKQLEISNESFDWIEKANIQHRLSSSLDHKVLKILSY